MFKLISVVLAGCTVFGNVNGDSLGSLVMGDWGGVEIAPYTTPQEITTAAGMAKVGKELAIDYAVVLGDNFYTHGIPTVNYIYLFI